MVLSSSPADDKSEDVRVPLPAGLMSRRPVDATATHSQDGSELRSVLNNESRNNPIQGSPKGSVAGSAKGSAKWSPGGSSNGSAASSRSGSRHRSRRQLIVGMSANIDAATRQRALDSGMDAFLPKVGLVVEVELKSS